MSDSGAVMSLAVTKSAAKISYYLDGVLFKSWDNPEAFAWGELWHSRPLRGPDQAQRRLGRAAHSATGRRWPSTCRLADAPHLLFAAPRREG